MSNYNNINSKPIYGGVDSDTSTGAVNIPIFPDKGDCYFRKKICSESQNLLRLHIT